MLFRDLVDFLTLLCSIKVGDWGTSFSYRRKSGASLKRCVASGRHISFPVGTRLNWKAIFVQLQ